MVINTTVDSSSGNSGGDDGITAQRLRELRARAENQEERLASQPKSTPENPFPDHKAPTQDELKKYQAKPDPKSLRTNPQGGCDY